jgi:hypothetical protein
MFSTFTFGSGVGAAEALASGWATEADGATLAVDATAGGGVAEAGAADGGDTAGATALGSSAGCGGVDGARSHADSATTAKRAEARIFIDGSFYRKSSL